MRDPIEEKWHQAALTENFYFDENDLASGPSGQPYLKIHPARGKSDWGYTFPEIALYAYDRSCGLILCESGWDSSDSNFLLLYFGDVVAYLMNGSLETPATAGDRWFLPQSEKEFMQCSDREPDMRVLPLQCRNTIAMIMRREGIANPRVALIVDVTETQRQTLTFNLWQSLNGNEAKTHEVAELIRWCLPSYYTVLITDDNYSSFSLAPSGPNFPTEAAPIPVPPKNVTPWAQLVHSNARFLFDPEQLTLDPYGAPYLRMPLAREGEEGITFRQVALFLYDAGIGAVLSHPGWDWDSGDPDFRILYLGDIVDFFQTGVLLENGATGAEWTADPDLTSYVGSDIVEPDFFLLPRASRTNARWALESAHVAKPMTTLLITPKGFQTLVFNVNENKSLSQADSARVGWRIMWGLPRRYTFLPLDSRMARFPLNSCGDVIHREIPG